MKKEIRCLICIATVIICIFVSLLADYRETKNLKECESNTTIKTTLQETTKKPTTESTTEEITIETTNPEIIETTKSDEKTETTTETSKYINLDEFELTAYCGCRKCNGKWTGSPTASGVMPKINHTIAVDPNVIPLGTKVVINGNTYVAEDTGSAIKGNKIDIFMSSHEEAMNFGVQYAEVFIVNE